ncbi:DNA-binding pseudobarrel domain-containing protein [Tanacetum coccineum]
MPVDFVRSAGIGTKKTITLKSLDGYEKEMSVRFETNYHYQAKRYCLRKGWMDFARSNNISVGDKCVFKFITSEDKLCLAKITKALPTQVDDDDVEVDSGMDDKDADKDVELVDGVDGGDPFFVVTISTIHKAMLRLPSDFVVLSGINTKENIIIKNLDGNERRMALGSYQQNNLTHYCLSMGWPAFMRSNSISEGDECVFKYITSEDKMCLAKVTTTETQTRLSSPPTVVKSKSGRPAKVVKRKTGRPAKTMMAENVKITVGEVVKRKRGRPAKVVRRKRGRPAKISMAENVKITVEEVVKRKRGRPPASPRATEDIKRKKGWEPCGHSADVEGVDKCVEVGKRPRGRPAKRLCGKAPQQK